MIVARASRRRRAAPLLPHGDRRLVEDLRVLFDREHYEEQAGVSFPDAESALAHYLEHAGAAYDPHPLFDAAYYADQIGRLRPGTSALAHYLEHAFGRKARDPNPLFSTTHYLALNADVKGSGENPLAHYLRAGWRQRRLTSRLQQRLLEELGVFSRRSLFRGRSRRDVALFFASEGARVALPLTLQDVLADEHDLQLSVVFARRPALPEVARRKNALALEDYGPDLLRPPARRMLAKTLSAFGPKLALVEDAVVLDALHEAGVPSHLLLEGTGHSAERLAELASRAARVIFTSPRPLVDGGIPEGLPTNVALRPFPADAAGPPSTASHAAERYARSLVELAARDVDLSRRAPAVLAAIAPPRSILVPCADWNLSGVNATLVAAAHALERRGWSTEILFTRDEAYVRESSGGSDRMPTLPHRFLRPERGAADGMWEALIREVEHRAPCIVLTGYDFVANSVVPALTEDVGVVMWVQSDDGDYYEQAYRLGRYCNALVCVSQHIRERIAALHPELGERAHVLHNASVSEVEVAPPRQTLRRTHELSIVYAGRLAQYQKRVLDFVELADALARRNVPFTIDLIGSFPVHDSAAQTFTARAARHLEAGRIRLLGPLTRKLLFAELAAHDFFVLLSDFEGFPLSLVEAMACGCVPVVAEIESGVPEVVRSGENGVVVPGRDYDAWAETICALWHDPPRATELASAASATIAQRFTVERMAERFDEILGRVAAEVAAGAYVRPPALHWGPRSSLTGDVLPPPSMYRPVPLPGLP